LISGTYTANSQSLSNFGKKEEVKDPVSWTKSYTKTGDKEYTLTFKAKVEPHWHFYSQYSEGTMPMAFYFDDIVGYERVGDVLESPKPKEEYDETLGGLTKYWDKSATFTQKIKLTSASANVHGAIEFQACIDGACTMLTYNFSFDIKDDASVKVAKPDNVVKEPSVDKSAKPVEKADKITSATDDNVVADANKVEDKAVKDNDNGELSEEAWKDLIYEPIIEDLDKLGNENSIANKSFLVIFLLGFVGGLVALMTPCVWPMIPMTVSFFLKKADKASGKRDAFIYGISIVLIYLAFGLGVTAIFGADAMNAMATSAIFNIIFFVILLVFAISFLGAFEIMLPTKWTNKMDEKADKTSGLLSIFFMAFTLVLVSFSCTGPIIGTLLVEAVTKGMWGPAIGMTGFSLALALPFTLFAIFPSMMKKMPKSGGWLNSVKVVLGFLELALALKFLSVADMAYHWHILDREVFLVLWIVIFALLGMYLLGKLMFSHDSKVEKVGIFRFFLAIISLSFALYMVPGLWGAPLKAISAFSPPITTQDFNLYEGTVEAKFDDYDDGMAYARKHKMPVIVDFTGWGCVNCRNMELAVWADPKVKEILEDDYVLISLFVDDKKPLASDRVRVSELTGNKLRSVGNLWSDLQISKFGQSSQPYYFALDYNGKPLTAPTAYELDVNKYKDFLHKGLKEFKKRFPKK
jgi:thiol:disulfide interchange protein DsbD